MQNQVRVNKLVVIETGTYNDIYHRRFEANLTAETEADLYRRLNPLRPYTSGHFASANNLFVKPEATPTGPVPIQNGWGAKRMRWVMELEWRMYTGSTLIQVLTGYTDETAVDISYSGHINQNANFYINNSFNFRVDYVPTVNGQMRTLSPVSGGQLLIDPTYQGILSSPVIVARPSDVIQTRALSKDNILAQLPDNEFIIDGPSLTSEAKFSARRNANPASYISKILESHRKSFIQNRQYGDNNDDIITEDTMTFSYDAVTNSDNFLNAIRNISGQGIAGNTFTLRDLGIIDPNYVNVIIPITTRNATASQANYLAQRHQRNGSDTWDASDYLTQMASLIANALPSIMADCALQRIALHTTNMDQRGGGRFFTVPSAPAGFVNDADLSEFIATCITRFEIEVMVPISRNGQSGVNLEVNCELNGDTRISLTIDGASTFLVMPSFCDAMYSPVIVGDYGHLKNITHMFNKVIDNATEHYRGSPNQQELYTGSSSSFTPPPVTNSQVYYQGDLDDVL